MEIGASSACFYPLETEKAFLTVARLGIKKSEIFFNTSSELRKPFINELKSVKDSFGMDVVSVHPYRSFAEGYDLFSEYERRYKDGVESFKRYFEAMSILGAKYFVLHGSKFGLRVSPEEYAERFHGLNEAAREFGCVVAHENVVDFSGATVEFMRFMKERLGDEFKMVLDVKQARRADQRVEDFIDAMGSSIVHVHLSDYDSDSDCVPPSEKGLFDFSRFFKKMDSVGYKGSYIVELYSNSFGSPEDVLNSAKYLDEIYKRVHQGQ